MEKYSKKKRKRKRRMICHPKYRRKFYLRLFFPAFVGIVQIKSASTEWPSRWPSHIKFIASQNFPFSFGLRDVREACFTKKKKKNKKKKVSFRSQRTNHLMQPVSILESKKKKNKTKTKKITPQKCLSFFFLSVSLSRPPYLCIYRFIYCRRRNYVSPGICEIQFNS